MASLAKDGMTRRYALFRRAMISLFKLFSGFEIHGEERVPLNGPLIVAANHRRFFDPIFVCMAVPRRVQWMAKKELFVAPLRAFFHLLGAFPVDRKGGGRSALKTALSYLSEGWTLGIFPEGTRRRDDGTDITPGEAKSGAIMLASRSGARILPVFIDRIPTLPARLRGAKLHAYIGEPITIDNTKRGRDSYRESADELLARIYALPEEFRGGDKQ